LFQDPVTGLYGIIKWFSRPQYKNAFFLYFSYYGRWNKTLEQLNNCSSVQVFKTQKRSKLFK
jgi:hypothetical protein